MTGTFDLDTATTPGVKHPGYKDKRSPKKKKKKKKKKKIIN